MAKKHTYTYHVLNKIERIKRGDPAETRSRARRNRMRNYLKEQEAKAEIQEVK